MTPKETVRAYVDAFNDGDWDRMGELFTPDGEIVGVLGSAPLERALPIWRELHEGMTSRLEIVALAEDGENVAARLRESGRFVGAFRGLADLEPTGRCYELLAMEWFEFSDGRIRRRWGARDAATLRRQVLG
ncbi:MAG TPA: ester cyclase [Phenylobacterium sp.]|nr:ester cyclase [Phenylobacterium sp.]